MLVVDKSTIMQNGFTIEYGVIIKLIILATAMILKKYNLLEKDMH